MSWEIYINLYAEMKNLLKYLILVLMATAFTCAAGWSGSSSEDAASCLFPADDPEFAEAFSSQDSALSVPRQVSTGTTHLQGNARRTANMHTRSLFEIVKSGKSFNVSVAYSVQRNSVIINTSIVGHSHKLVCLGRLII